MKLWYKSPAQAWIEALPLGNGALGAMMFGGTACERIAINEDTFWTGHPRETDVPGAAEKLARAQELIDQNRYLEASDYVEDALTGKFTQSYLPVGDILISYPSLKGAKARKYRRELNLERAVFAESFEAEGMHIDKEAFISAPDGVMCMQIRCDHPGGLHLIVRADCQVRHSVFASDQTLYVDMRAPSYCPPSYRRQNNTITHGETPEQMGMRARMQLKCTSDGEIRTLPTALEIVGAQQAQLFICVKTSFAGFDKFPEKQGKNEKKLVDAQLRGALSNTYEELKARHEADFTPRMNRVTFRLNQARANLPTDERLRRGPDGELYELLFAYGRYLLLSCSRPGTQAANLQGIWNQDLRPAWSSNYTININTEMNYWPADLCNMAETTQPLFDLIERLRVTGARTAKIHYGARGAVAHHNTDLWALSNPVGEGNRGFAGCAFWPMGYAWLTRHMAEHDAYFPDRTFLKKHAFPAVRDAALFFLDVLREDPDGYLSFYPATSPENGFLWAGKRCRVAYAAAMSSAIVREVFENYLEMAKKLGVQELTDEISNALPRLHPLNIGPDGRLLEWERDYEEYEPHHRHVSHLYALHPAHLITPQDTPLLAKACEKTLLARGDDGTGWSLGWKINFWARLGDGDHALKLIDRQLRFVTSTQTEMSTGGGTYANLFDAHPPFQIDGNFGACAGIAELFVQNRPGTALLLPALPQAWQSGKMHGLRLFGGYACDLDFEDGRLTRCEITCDYKSPAPIDVCYGQGRVPIKLRQGESITLTAADFQ